jgi:hypothetical protein
LTNTDHKQPKQVQKMSESYPTEKFNDPEDQDVSYSSRSLSSLQISERSLREPVAQKSHLVRKRQLSVSLIKQ